MAENRHTVAVTDDSETILNADRIVFPGQGAIGDCMRSLEHANLIDVLLRGLRSRPFLGICLGLQSLMTTSDEDGGTQCLDRFAGSVRRFPHDPPPAADGTPQKIPHMGWNQVRWQREHPVIAGIPSGARFYFVHSYFVVPADKNLTIGETDYVAPFTSAIARENVFATQFHPEKSASNGLRLLKNFLDWDGLS